MASVLRIFPRYARRNLYRNTKRQGIISLCDDLVSLRRFGLNERVSFQMMFCNMTKTAANEGELNEGYFFRSRCLL